MLDLPAQVEALLFAAPGPLSDKQLAAAFRVSPSQIQHALRHLQTQLAGRGIILQSAHGQWQLATHPLAAEAIERLWPERAKPAELSKAALETLSVIVFRGPISQAEIEKVRGVAADQSLRTLLGKGLIEELPGRGQPPRYGASHTLLGQLGISHTGQLTSGDHAD